MLGPVGTTKRLAKGAVVVSLLQKRKKKKGFLTFSVEGTGLR